MARETPQKPREPDVDLAAVDRAAATNHVADGPPADVTPRPERVGVLVVHGIGEQRRFEHLEEQTKKIANAILKREERTEQRTRVTFEVLPASGGAPYQSDQESWQGGRFPSVRALVQHGDNLEHETHLYFHEVWWADVNEAPTFGKQLRFWGWGLAMWTIRGKRNSQVAGFGSMRAPMFPDQRRDRLSGYNRWQLFLLAWIFLLSSFSITLAVFVLKRLNFGVWSPVNALISYMSGVKLYTQSHRSGGGPLDGVNEPPRFTIRRRMVRALVDVATADYDRWYVLAHSLGSVVAFNGLMTHAHSIPNYLDERRWRRLVRHNGWVGPPRPGMHETFDEDDPDGEARPEIPPRPLWIADDRVVVYRERLFARLRGLLTYGSPLDKFAGMWPAYVPINRANAFGNRVKWINIFDRTDAVAASLKAYGRAGLSTGLSPQNHGYPASLVLLLGHLKYLDLRDGPQNRGREPADYIVNWLLLDHFGSVPNFPIRDTPGWYQVGSGTSRFRWFVALLQWIVVAALLAYIGTWVLRGILQFIGSGSPIWPTDLAMSFRVSPGLSSWLFGFLDVDKACASGCTTTFGKVLALRPGWIDVAGLAGWGLVSTLLIGLLGRFIQKDDDNPHNW